MNAFSSRPTACFAAIALIVGCHSEPEPSVIASAHTPAQEEAAARQRNTAFRFTEAKAGFSAENAGHSLFAHLGNDGLSVLTSQRETTALTLRTVAFGRDRQLQEVAAGEAQLGACADARRDVDGKCLQRIELAHDDLTEWWVNRADGLEHGFDVMSAPEGTGELVVKVAVTGARTVVRKDGQSVRFERETLPALDYAGLLVTDASKKRLPARIAAVEGGLALRVDDRGASYPLRIDPVLSSTADRDIALTGIGSIIAPAGDIWWRTHTLDGHGTDLLAGIPSTGEVKTFSLQGSSYVTRTATKPTTSTAYGFAKSVSAAGDYNCDGFLDWAVSAPDPSASDTDSPGVVYVFPGSLSEGSSTATTWSLSNVVIQRGNSDDSEFGAALAFGDLNRDGCAELIVGAPGTLSGKGNIQIFSTGGNNLLNFVGSYDGTFAGSRLGSSFAVGDFDGLGGQGLAVGMPAYNSNSGGVLFFEHNGSGLLDMTPDFTFTGGAGAKMGTSLAYVGDIKGDGRGGLLIGSPGVSPGGQSNVQLRVPSVQSGSTASGFVSMQRTDGLASGDQFGASVAAVGDLNGDGLGDWAVGAPGADANGQTDSGQVTVFYGAGTDIYTSELHSGTYGSQQLGLSVAGAGDFNDDGFSDVAMGYNGGIQVFYGSAGDTSLKAYKTDTIADYVTVADIKPTESTDIGFGKSIDWAGDINGDGYQDVVIGAPGANSGGGRFYVRFGAATSPLSTGFSVDGAGTLGVGTQVAGVGDVDGDRKDDLLVTSPGEGAVYWYYTDYTNWTSYNAVPQVASGMTGGSISIASAGDVNGDGIPDFIIGWTGANSGAGRATVYQNGRGADPTTVTTLNGQAASSTGQSVAGLGDVNGDGYDDIAVGSPLQDTGTADVGQVAVYLGSATGVSTTAYFTATGSQANQNFGYFVARVGDVNGDGLADLGVGSPDEFVNGGTRGQAYVFLATSTGFNASPTVLDASANAPAVGEKLGIFMTGGDFNGDSISDVIVSSNEKSYSRHIYTGGTGGLVTSGDTTRYRTWYKGNGTSAARAPMVLVGDVNGDFIPEFASAANGLSGVVDYVTVIRSNARPTRYSATTAHLNIGLADYLNTGEMRVDFYPPTQGPAGRVTTSIGFEGTPLGSPRIGITAGARDASIAATYVPRYYDPKTATTPLILNNWALADGTGQHVRMRVVYNPSETVVVPHSPWMFISRGTDITYKTTACGSNRDNDRFGGSCNVCPTDYYGFYCTYCTRSATCNNHGTCGDSPLCTCDSGYAGSSCQYSDAVTCGGHGKVSSTGTCTCNTGFAGSTCQYSDATTCNARGTAKSDGTCTCNTGSAGTHCEYTDATTCNAHGTAQSDGSCACTSTYSGARCDSCGANRYSYPTCTFCDATSTCSAHGSCDASGACQCNTGFTNTSCNGCSANHYNYPSCTLCDTTTCNGFTCTVSGTCSCGAGYAGSGCQYTDSGTCNGRGTAQNDGSCVCSNVKYAGTRCEGCATGLTGSDCQYSNATTCNSNGTAQFDGSCVCSSGFAGASCQYSDATTCSAHGAAQTNGSCACTSQFSGTSCDGCAANYFVYPTCSFCTAGGTCNGNGTCASDGSCSCSSGAAGTHCEYTDSGTCNGHGSVNASGACSCQALFTGTRCQSCITGRAGPNCEYTDAGTCGGNGVAQFDGSCVCNSGFAGSTCQYSASATCNNHGSVAGDGSCACSAAYASAACDQCATDYYVYPGCTFCQASTTCNAHGTCTNTGTCSCASGAAGNRCQYTDAATCNGHGTAQADGSCACRAEFLGSACTQCVAGRAGSDCQYTDVDTCNGHGTAQSNGSCVCSGNYTGSGCQYSPDTTCSAHGSVSFTGVCTCDSVHGGSACDQCASNRFNYPGCATFCQASTTCNAHGTCSSTGTCTCDAHAAGSTCQFTRAATCKGHGEPDASGACTCDTGFTGVDCSSCSPNYYGANCAYCVASDTCNGHGTCASGGGCTCNAGYAGATCNACAPDNYAYPACTPCTRDVTCRGRGTCQSNGTCACDSGSGYSGSECQFSNAASCTDHGFVSTSGSCQCSDNYKGTSCDACNDNYIKYPTCKYCLASVSCHGNGSCDDVGSCVCKTGFAGSDCNYSRTGTCSGHGNPTNDGLCQCDSGYGGRQCQLSRQTNCKGHGDPQEGGTCLCDAGYIGADCSVSQAGSCNGHGVASLASDGSVKCACADGFAGDKCDSCSANHFDYPACRRCDNGTCNPQNGSCQSTGACKCYQGHIGSACQYSDLSTCHFGGTALLDGSCNCDSSHAGPGCIYSRTFTCSSYGMPDAKGTCTCDKGYVGTKCETCDTDYYRRHPFNTVPFCFYCKAETTCHGGGTCDDTGACVCGKGFAGDTCQYNDKDTCHGHGSAQSDGSCVCADHFAGAHCEKCASSWSADDCSIFCDDQITCEGHGNCKTLRSDLPERCACLPGGYSAQYTDNKLPWDRFGKPTTCHACPAGFKCDGTETRTQCAAGTYAPAGSSECKACPENWWAAAGASECTPCKVPEGLPVCTAWRCDSKTGKDVFTQALACSMCGNGKCDKDIGETCSICAKDCGTCYVCGDAMCDATHGETCRNCTVDCLPCSKRKTNPPPAPTYPSFTPPGEGPDSCGSGPPLVGGGQTPAWPLVYGGESSSSLNGNSFETDIRGTFTYKEGYEDGQCTWKLESGVEIEQCLETEESPVKDCGAAEMEQKIECTAPPRCTDDGYVCALDTPYGADICDMELKTRFSVARKIGWRKSFGVIFVDLELSAGLFVDFSQVAKSGSRYLCPEGSLRIAGQEGNASLTMGFEASATASAGVRAFNHDFSFSATAKACFGLKSDIYDNGCDGPSKTLKRSTEFVLELPKLEWYGFTVFDLGEYKTETGGGCF